MSDIFNEINQELAQDRALRFWQRNFKFIIAAVIAVFIATAAYSIWKPRHERAQMAATSALLNAGQDQDKLQVLAQQSGNQAVLAEVNLAAAALQKGDKAAALTHYQKLADSRTAPDYWQNMARANAASIQLDQNNFVEAEKNIKTLLGKNNAFRPQALELNALLAAKQNNKKAAYDNYAELSAEQNAPAILRDRARSMMRFYQE